MPLDPELDPHFDEAARLHNLDPMLLRAMASGESSFNPNAVSRKGAVGLMGFMPETAASLGIDPTDRVQAIYGAARHLNDRLSFHEAQKENNPNIAPVDEALKDYIAGASGAKRGPETAGYPGFIASRYQQLAGGGQPAPTGIDALAAAGPSQDTPGRMAYSPNGQPIGRVPAPAWEPGIPLDPNMPKSREARIAELANASTASRTAVQPLAGNAVPGQTAQSGPSDEELLKAFNEVFPTGGKGAVSASGPPTVTPTTAPTASQALDPTTVNDAWNRAERARRLGEQPHPGDVAIIQRAITGDPEYLRAVKSSEAAGANQQVRGPGGELVNEPGATESAADKAAAVTTAQQKAVRKSEADRPTDLPPGHMSILPVGSPAAEKWIQASKEGFDLPPGVTINPNGSVQMFNNPGISKSEEIAADAFGKQKDAFIGNQNSVQNLQNFLEAAEKVGTGKGTEYSAKAAAWLKSLNIDPEKLSLADPAETEKMRKASTQMVFSAIRGVSSRPAYQEFQMLAQGMPNPDLQPEANRAIAASLLGRMGWENELYSAWNANQRATHSYSAFDDVKWSKNNPMNAFQASAYGQVPAIPERTIAGPTKGAASPVKEWTIRDGKLMLAPAGASP